MKKRILAVLLALLMMLMAACDAPRGSAKFDRKDEAEKPPQLDSPYLDIYLLETTDKDRANTQKYLEDLSKTIEKLLAALREDGDRSYKLIKDTGLDIEDFTNWIDFHKRDLVIVENDGSMPGLLHLATYNKIIVIRDESPEANKLNVTRGLLEEYFISKGANYFWADYLSFDLAYSINVLEELPWYEDEDLSLEFGRMFFEMTGMEQDEFYNLILSEDREEVLKKIFESRQDPLEIEYDKFMVFVGPIVTKIKQGAAKDLDNNPDIRFAMEVYFKLTEGQPRQMKEKHYKEYLVKYDLAPEGFADLYDISDSGGEDVSGSDEE